MTEKFSLKDVLFNPAKVDYLANLISVAYPQFNTQQFSRQITDELPQLELKQRIFCICNNLTKHLPNDFKTALNIILKSLPSELDPNKTDDDFGDFIFAPFSYFVVTHGLCDKYLDLSLNALAQITKRFSVEDAIRFFINQYPEQSFAFMQTMAHSNNYHQRRLASEGLRPKLPWCVKLDFDYQQAILILDTLYCDKTRYVVRSVANHLNDIAKIDKTLVIQTLAKWQQNNKQHNQKEWHFLVNHSLRTLLKQGDGNALMFLGFRLNPTIIITSFKIKNQQIKLGSYLEFSFNISGTKGERLIIDYKIIYPTQTNKISSKVFKLKQLTLNGNSVKINKKHLFKAMTTKKLYSGCYHLHLQINGSILLQEHFNLNV